MSSEDLFADSLPSNLSPGSLGSMPIDASGVVGSDLDDSISLPSDFELSDCFMLSDDEVVPSSDEDAEDADSEMDVADLGGVDVKKDLVSPRRSSTRRKRGAFKKGFLKQRRRSRSSSRGSSSSRDPSLGSYSDAVSEFLNAELTDGDEGSHHGDSCYSTMPSEGEMTVGVDDDDREQEIEQTEGKLKPSPTVQRRRKSKMIGRKKKYFWKDPPENATETEPSEKVTHTEKSVKDFGTSTEVKDLKMSLEYASSSLSGDQILSTVADYLKLTIDDWVVSLSDGTLMLCKIINPLNPYVERAITWDGKKVNFLVHNTPLPSRNVCWSIKRPDPGNFGSVADYLTTVANRVDYFEVCSGIQTHQHFWSKFSNGTCTENHSGSPVMRSSKCCYLRVYAGRCSNCHGILTKMLDHERKLSKKSEDRDESKTNYRYLSKEDLEKKCRRIQQEKKLSKQAVRRLRKRIDILLKKNSQVIDSGLSEEFETIMNENSDKLTGIEKIFWEQQRTALSKRGAKKTMRWHPAMIRLALQLRMLSPAAYDFMSGFLSLPSKRRLFDYSQFIEVKEGLQEDLLQKFHDTLERECPDDYQKYFNLLVDEMSIRSDLVYNSRTGEVVGFTNLTTLEEALASLESEIQGKTHEKRLAKKVLVFMVTGSANKIRFVPAFYSTDDLSSTQLYTRSWDVIYGVEETGAKILAVICDGASVNRKFINMHTNMGDTKFVHVTVNSASGDSRNLFFMLDPPHLIKTFRNCFANSFSHRNSRALCNNDQEISWKSIEELLKIIKAEKYKETKLTDAHVHLTSFSCMKVGYAVQVFSKSVAKALDKYKDILIKKGLYNEELVRFILNMNRWFDCLNGGVDSKKKSENCDLLEYTSVEDPRFDFLQKDFLEYLEKWENFVASREGTYSKEKRSRMIISYQSLVAMKITIHSFIGITKFLLEKKAPSVSARNFNQDPLEQYFSDQRRARGADNNPHLKQFGHTRLSIEAVGYGQMAAGGKRGNTEDLRQMAVDASPLPVRKKQKKE